MKPNPTAEEQRDLQRLDDLEAAIRAWRLQPFKPHLVARTRTTAYQKNVVMKYIDNLIAWADQLFRRDTIETINEATQLYVLAADILGPRPVEIPPRRAPQVQTFNSLEQRLDQFSNALVEVEALVPLDADAHAESDSTPQPPPTLLYFCLPKNDKLLGYWDTVADRLFKICHCMNILGVIRRLPLFGRPIDPALLIRGVAAGLDLDSLLNDIEMPLPAHRFTVWAAKTNELCAELRNFGAKLSRHPGTARRRGACAPAGRTRERPARYGRAGEEQAARGSEPAAGGCVGITRCNPGSPEPLPAPAGREQPEAARDRRTGSGEGLPAILGNPDARGRQNVSA